jgi:hypothetical protein
VVHTGGLGRGDVVVRWSALASLAQLLLLSTNRRNALTHAFSKHNEKDEMLLLSLIY